MGKRGPRSSAPGGYGNITPKGYRRVWHGGRLWLEHRLVWESANGPVLSGHDIHHINGDKLDNEITNLRILDKLTHSRIHNHGCTFVDGVWHRSCPDCHRHLPITAEHWYFTRKHWPSYHCRPCHIRRVVKRKQERRAEEGAA